MLGLCFFVSFAMRHHVRIREEVVNLRKMQGLSLDELSERFGISRTTIYYWIRNIPFATPTGKRMESTSRQKANQKAGTAANQAKCAAVRQAAYDAMYSKAREVLQDQEIRDFAVLYLAEGYRKSRNSVSFGNSNPKMIRFAYSTIV